MHLVEFRRRTAPLRLERLQFGALPLRAASAYRTELPYRARASCVAALSNGYQAESARTGNRADNRAGRGDRPVWIFATSYRALRTGGNLCERARIAFGRWSRRNFP